MSATDRLCIDSGLVNHARTAAALSDRTISAQIEHWAKLGRALEAVLTEDSILRIKKIEYPAGVVGSSQNEEGARNVRVR